MEWWVNLILWGTVLWIPILMYVQTVNDAKFKKNIVFFALIWYHIRTENINCN